MLNNNHVQIVMGIIRAINEDKKLKGFKFRSEEELKVTEKKIISFVNFYNKIINFLVNNKVSIFIKEAFYWFGVPYPEYVYNDALNEYIVSYGQGWMQGYYTVLGVKINAPVLVSEASSTPDFSRALDVSKYPIWKKKYLLFMINKTYMKSENPNGKYRLKRILTYT